MPFVVFNKPFDVVSQFSDSTAGTPTLADFIEIPDVYGVGRLDKTSEGLLLLTDDGRLNHAITQPAAKVQKSYWVQVEGEPTPASLHALIRGVVSRKQQLRAYSAKRIEPPPVWSREPPIRVRKHIPDCWLEIVLTEGKNRQIRRMTAAIGHPTLRLIRAAVGPWQLDGLVSGELRILSNSQARAELDRYRNRA